MRITSTRDLAAAVRGRRKSLHLSQAELARRAGVSRPWLSNVEAGKPSVEFGLVMRLLDALDLHLDVREHDDGTDPGAPAVDLDALLEEYRTR